MSTRIEEFLRACVDGVKCALKPLTRVETLLAALNDKLAGSAPTVILEETELITVDVTPGESGYYLLDKPLAAPLVDGATYEIVFGGEKYTSKAADATALEGMVVAAFLLGRTPNEENIPSPGPDCPFTLVIVPNGVEDAGVKLYGQMDSTVTPDPPTLSIVEKAGAGSGGGVLVARVEALEEDVNALSKEIAKLGGGTEIVSATGTLVSVDAEKGAKIKVEANTAKPVTLVHQGKNFLAGSALSEKTIGDLTLKQNDDGTVSVAGTITESGTLHFYHPNLNGKLFLPAGTYTLSNDFAPTRAAVFTIYKATLDELIKVAETPFNRDRVTFTLDEGTDVRIALHINADVETTGKACDFVLHCQLEPGTTVTDYEQKVIYGSQETSLPVTLTAESGKNVIYTMGNDELTVSMEIGKGSGIDENAVNALIEKATKFDATVWGLPVLELTGDTSVMTKDDAVDLSYVYGDLSGTCSVKWQGSSSIRYAKKNYTIKFDNAFEAKDGWGEQKKYCFKANYIDHSHARNVVNAKLWGQIVKCRSDVSTELASLPNAGAVDGFPCIITLNGEFHGLYTFNIPKDGWMFGMGSGTNEAILCADQHVAACRFKGEANLASDFELEYVSDENNAEWVTASMNRLINACINSDGTDLDTTVAQYIDWQSVIDYYIFTVMITGDDMTDKNYLLATFDGVKWYFSAYDMDCTYGLFWDGSTFVQANASPSFASYASVHRAMELVKTYKKDELKARYAQLRDGVLSESNIATVFANFTGVIASPVYMQDVKTWPMIPNTSTNNISQIRDYYRMRCEIADKWMEDL